MGGGNDQSTWIILSLTLKQHTNTVDGQQASTVCHVFAHKRFAATMRDLNGYLVTDLTLKITLVCMRVSEHDNA